MKRTRTEALETRERILDSAETEFSANGVTHTALEDIALAAGVTRGAIYGHFRNKVDLFDAMVSRVKLPMTEIIDAVADPLAEDPLGLLRASIVKCLRDVARDPHTHRVLTILFTKCEYSSEIDGLLDRTSGSYREGRSLLARGMRNTVRKGQLPSDLDTRRAAAMLHAFIGGTIRGWLLDPGSMALPRDASRVADVAVDMLRFSPSLRTPRRARPDRPATPPD